MSNKLIDYLIHYDICIMSFHNRYGYVNLHIQFLKTLFYFGILHNRFITNMEFKSSSYKMQNIKQTFFFETLIKMYNNHVYVYAIDSFNRQQTRYL